MKMKKIAAIAATVLMLVSCAQHLPANAPPVLAVECTADSVAAIGVVLARFPEYVTNDNPPVDGGFLNYGIMTGSPLRGVFHPNWAMDTVDGWVGNRIMDPILETDESLMFSQNGMARYELDTENSTITLTLQRDVYWHDGVPLTMRDYMFSYEIIAHPDYDGARFGSAISNVVGVSEYNAGEADYISGLVLSDCGRSLTIHLHNLTPMIQHGGIWMTPTAKHHFEGIPVSQMSSHPHARHRMLGTGAFMPGRYVPGEGIQLLANPDYWQGAPRLCGINVEAINPELVPFAMREGRFDIAEFSAQQFADFQNPTNYVYLASASASYSYTGFRFGNWCHDTGEVSKRPGHMDCVYLRRAIAYAIDHAQLGRIMMGGLRFPATSVVPPFHDTILDGTVPGFPYNPERARQLLDEAGYLDIDGDGFRENPDGTPLVITWATMAAENDEIYTAFKLQQWADVGLNVRLFRGRTLDFHTFYSYIESDADEGSIDMFDAAWSVGLNPDPAVVWGHDTVLNFTRYTSPCFQDILRRIASEEMWCGEFRRRAFDDWQWAFYNEVPAIPTLWRIQPIAVNNRVRNFSLERADGTGQVSLGAWHLVELTADVAERAARVRG